MVCSSFLASRLLMTRACRTNRATNLWPEPYDIVWNAHVKDRLEGRLHRMVCAGELDLATAQKAIAKDWISAYQQYGSRTKRRQN
jgi:hypothetical protein